MDSVFDDNSDDFCCEGKCNELYLLLFLCFIFAVTSYVFILPIFYHLFVIRMSFFRFHIELCIIITSDAFLFDVYFFIFLFSLVLNFIEFTSILIS